MSRARVTRIEFNDNAFRKIMRSQPVIDELNRRGKAIAEAAGEGVGTQVNVGATRARVTVMTETHEARVAEAERKTLTSALGAARR